MSTPGVSSTENTVLDQAGQAVARQYLGQWAEEEQIAFQRRIDSDPEYAAAVRQVELSLKTAGTLSISPEVMAFREQAIARARRSAARRWSPRVDGQRWRRVAAIAAITTGILSLLQWSPWGYRRDTYSTGIGEQRMVELADHTRIALDAKTRLRVRFSTDTRTVQLVEGQAQFFVAQEPGRPFKVVAGDQTIVALGTVFTVECVDRKVHVAMMEGRVAVVEGEKVPQTLVGDAPRESGAVELSAGQELRINGHGRTAVTQKADLDAATAWRQGRVIFRDEQLGDAVKRLNRYSSLQLVIDDPALSEFMVTGVFDASDTRAFIEAMHSYVVFTTDASEAGKLHLKTP